MNSSDAVGEKLSTIPHPIFISSGHAYDIIGNKKIYSKLLALCILLSEVNAYDKFNGIWSYFLTEMPWTLLCKSKMSSEHTFWLLSI